VLQKVESGLYENASEVVRAALRTLVSCPLIK
jgi:putative addiction module CopG family antidote